MKSINTNALLLFTLIALPFHTNSETIIQDQDLQDARSLVKVYGGNLKSTLKSAIKSGGPVNGISACNLQVSVISEGISTQSGWKVSRTSLKVRNERNKPDAWELKTLLQFEQRKEAGEALKAMEHSETVMQNGESIYRYMKVIPTAGLCLNCHGNKLDNVVLEKLNVLYPHDKATGFSIGDIRGAFSLQKIKGAES